MAKKGKISAGLLMYRRKGEHLELFLVHPGGPYFVNKWDGYWSIPKGIVESGEKPLASAIREFEEETGLFPESESFIELGTITQKNGKIVHAWAFEGDWNEDQKLVSNTFTMEWPPRSGCEQEFPEIDQGKFFDLSTVHEKVNECQWPLIERLIDHLE